MPEEGKDKVTDVGLETVKKAREEAQRQVGGVTAPGHLPGQVGQPEAPADVGQEREEAGVDAASPPG
jgi:hypothetical protein